MIQSTYAPRNKLAKSAGGCCPIGGVRRTRTSRADFVTARSVDGWTTPERKGAFGYIVRFCPQTSNYLRRLSYPVQGRSYHRGGSRRARFEAGSAGGTEETGPRLAARSIHCALLRVLSVPAMPEYPACVSCAPRNGVRSSESAEARDKPARRLDIERLSDHQGR